MIVRLLGSWLLLVVPAVTAAQETGPAAPQNSPIVETKSTDSLEIIISGLRVDSIQKNNEIASVRNALRDSVAQLDRARRHGSDLEARLSEQGRALVNLAQEHETVKGTVRTLQGHIDTLQTRRDFLTRTLSSANAELARVRLTLTDLQIRVHGRTAELVRERRERAAAVGRANAQELTIQQKGQTERVLQQEIQVKDSRIAAIHAEKQKNRADYEEQLRGLRKVVQWTMVLAFGVTILLLLTSGVLAWSRARKGHSILDVSTLPTDASTTELVNRTARLWQWHTTLSLFLRSGIVLGVVLVALLTSAFVVFLVRAGALGLDLLAQKEFWQAVGALGLPVAFMVAAYNSNEGRLVELSRLLFEMAEKSRAPETHPPQTIRIATYPPAPVESVSATAG